MSCRRPSNASSRVSGPCGPVSARLASTSTMGRRRRAAAIASPSRVCAFSRTRSLYSSAWKVARPTAAGRLGALVAPAAGLPMSADSSFMTVPLLVLCVRGFGEPFDRAESPVPLDGELSHSPGGLGEAIQVLGPAAPVLAGIALFLRVGPGEQLVAAFDHAKTGPLVALGCQRELDEHRVAGHRLLPAGVVPAE